MKVEILKEATAPEWVSEVEEAMQAGKPGNLDTILQVLQLDPKKLYLCCGVQIEGLEIFAEKSARPNQHWARMREQFKRQLVEPDALIIRPGRCHRKIYAWWGASFQNALSQMSLFRGMKTRQVLALFDHVGDPGRFKEVLYRKKEPLILSPNELIQMGWKPPEENVSNVWLRVG